MSISVNTILLDKKRFTAIENSTAFVVQGSLTLVGAGPGDPELITLKAIRALQQANVVLLISMKAYKTCMQSIKSKV